MSLNDSQIGRISFLLNALGIDPESFLSYVEWALSEQLVDALVEQCRGDQNAFFAKPDSLRRFRDHLVTTTGRKWSEHDLNLLHAAAKNRLDKHHRAPIPYGEYLKLLWTVPHRCHKCGKVPPSVKLHVDHILPSSKGGKSVRANLQFLCEHCNLRKSSKIEGGNPWLDLT